MTEILTLDDAVARVIDAVPQAARGIETVPIDSALGRTMAVELRAEEPWPVTDRSAMDGFALAAGDGGAADGQTFPVVGAALAGHPFDGELRPGQAVRIMTGGVVPPGADLVARVEDTSGFVDGQTDVTVTTPIASGANIRPLGSEIAVGDVLLRPGWRIRSAEVGALAVLGQAQVEVAAQPRVAILSTGDEVVDVASSPLPHQVRDSNSWALRAKADEWGGRGERLGIIADDGAALRAAFENALQADIVVTIGGVSKGTHDLVHGTMESLGVEKVFHGVALKPGKPTFFGIKPGDRPTYVFGLPGNPASASTTFDLFVAPAIRRLQGAEAPRWVRARRTGDAFRKNWRAQLVPARVTARDGELVAELASLRPSGDPFGLVLGHGYAVVPGDAEPENTPVVDVVLGPDGFGESRS